MAHIHPSLLAADFSRLATRLDAVQDAQYLHIDIMDGHFVPNHTFGPHVVAGIKHLTTLPLEFHMLVANPADVLEQYIPDGDRFIVHVESDDVVGALAILKKAHKEIGLGINPGTAVERVKPFLDAVHFVCIMGVEPGFSGQKYIPETDVKLEVWRQFCGDHRRLLPVLLDGGVTADVITHTAADSYVVGSTLFSHDSAEAIRQEFLWLKQL